ncbi:MAG: hypothetical protein IT379_24545, partial [Deltaproteobacteria bacterium]|nr:hypothetical protein [Deltaproteobacteria bacterium]
MPAATAMLVAALTTSCADKTSLLINVTSDDLVVPTDLDVLEIQVVGDESGQMATARYELSRPFPHSISVRPGRSTSEEMTVTVTAGMLGSGGGADRFVARRVARSRFVDGETVVLTLELTRRCVGVMCATGIDCVEGICTAPSTDGGVPEAGPDVRDMAQDTGPVDAGPDVRDMGNDLGPPACRELDCDDGDSCTSDSCDDTGAVPVCVSTTRDLDGDGHGTTLCPEVGGVPADDCDDGDDTLAPGLPEACNGRDDDCDEECDEDFECCRGESRGCATS